MKIFWGSIFAFFIFSSVVRADVHLSPPVASVADPSAALQSKDFAERFEAFRLIAEKDEKKLKQVALAFLKDPALLIRLQAVRVLKDYAGESSIRQAFWQAFESELNVKRGKPLLSKIRIFEILSTSPNESELKKFTKHKNDEQLGTFAKGALAQLKAKSGAVSDSGTSKSLVR